MLQNKLHVSVARFTEAQNDKKKKKKKKKTLDPPLRLPSFKTAAEHALHISFSSFRSYEYFWQYLLLWDLEYQNRSPTTEYFSELTFWLKTLFITFPRTYFFRHFTTSRYVSATVKIIFPWLFPNSD